MDNKKINKKDAILAAAEKEFVVKGYEGAKMTAIAKLAGVTHAMLHYYFTNKETLFNEVFENKFKLVRDVFYMSFAESKLSLIDKIRLSVEKHFDFVAKNPDIPLFILSELRSNPERVQIFRAGITNVVDNVFPMIQKELDEEAEKGHIEKVDVVQLVLNIVSLNVFVFASRDIINSFMTSPKEERLFWRKRKLENVEVVLSRLIKK